MGESIAVAKEADAKKSSSPTRSSSKSIHRVQNEHEMQLGSLGGVISNKRSNGGTPSVESIAAHLRRMHIAQRAPALLALQQTYGNRYVQRVVSGIQAKLVVGQPWGLYELEADRVVDEVMRRAVGKGTTQAEGQTASLTNTAPDNSQHPELPPPRKGENPLSYEHIEGKAFVRGVKPSDVKQLGLAACGLLAALSAVAAVNPEKILKSIRYRGGDQWDVLLYSKERTSVWITINQDLPVHVETGAMALVSGTEAELKQKSIKPQYKDEKAAIGLEASLMDPVLPVSEELEKEIRQQLESMRTRWIITYGPDMAKQELWPALYVKAVAILVAKYPIMPRRGSEPGGYDDLESIGQDVAIEIITGQPAQLIGSTEVSEDELFTVMNKAWLNDQPVTAGSLSLDGKKEERVKIPDSGIYYDHAYTVLRTWKPEGNPVVDLRNPWGNPEFRLGFREFKQLFDSVAIGNQRVERVLQRAAANAAPLIHVPSIVYEVLRSPGQPLNLSTRMLMEPHFGHNFSDVRVHTDPKATESARAVNALAYTVRHDIMFGAGQYNPTSKAGQKLLAHELTHVIQQQDQHTNMHQNNPSISTPGDAAEVEANAIADIVSDNISSETVPYLPDLAVNEKPPDCGRTSMMRSISISHFLSDAYLARRPDDLCQDPSYGFTPATLDVVNQEIAEANSMIDSACSDIDIRAAEDLLMKRLEQRIHILNVKITEIEENLPNYSETTAEEESQCPTSSDLLHRWNSLQEERGKSQQQLRLLRRKRAIKKIAEIESKLLS